MLAQLVRETLRSPSSGARLIRQVAAYRWAQEAARQEDNGVNISSASERQLKLACARSGCEPAEMLHTVARWMDAKPLQYLARHRRPGLLSFLTRCAQREIALAVLSDYPCREKLIALSVADFFQVTLSAFDPEVAAFKPSPKGIVAVLQRLGVHREFAVYIGDRPEVDAAAAHAAGVRAVIVGASRVTRQRIAGVGGTVTQSSWHAVKDFNALSRDWFDAARAT